MRTEFTLLRFGSAVEIVSLEVAASIRTLPLKVLDLKRPDTAIFYDGRLAVDPYVTARSTRPGTSGGVDRSCSRRCLNPGGQQPRPG
jgi:hypothetical protein